jgi:hypothetical protein
MKEDEFEKLKEFTIELIKLQEEMRNIISVNEPDCYSDRIDIYSKIIDIKKSIDIFVDNFYLYNVK